MVIHCTGISKILGSAIQLCCTFTNNSLSLGTLTLPHGTKPRSLSLIPSILGFLLHLRLHFHQWLLPSLSQGPQSNNTVPNLGSSLSLFCAFKVSTPWVTLTLLSLAASMRYNIGPSGPQILYTGPKQTLLDLGSSMTLVSSELLLASQPQLTSINHPSEDFTSVVLVSC